MPLSEGYNFKELRPQHTTLQDFHFMKALCIHAVDVSVLWDWLTRSSLTKLRL